MRRSTMFALVATIAAFALGAATPRGRPPPPPPPAPLVALTLDAQAPDRAWIVKVANTGDDPVRIVADPRLFSFDVIASGATARTAAIHCALPSDMTPTTDTERTLFVPGHRAWSVRIDPLLYCFSAAQAASLHAGTTVTASFGFSQTRYAPPFALTPTLTDGGVGPAQRVSATPITLADPQPIVSDAGVATRTDASTPTPQTSANDAYPVHMKVSLPERLDVARAFEQTVTVSIENTGDRPVRTLITSPTIGFVVQAPNGTISRCGADMAVSAIAELTTTLAPHARTAQTIDIGSTCGTHFRQPGLYRVRPRLDTRRSAPPPGMPSFWGGEIIGAPMLMRVRVGEDPMAQPRLDLP